MITFILELMFFFGAVVLLVLGVNAYHRWAATNKKRARARRLFMQWDTDHGALSDRDTRP